MTLIEVHIKLVLGLSIQKQNAFWEKYIEQAIEGNRLQYGGLEHGFIEPDGNFELTERHKNAVHTWLQKHPDVQTYEMRMIHVPDSNNQDPAQSNTLAIEENSLCRRCGKA